MVGELSFGLDQQITGQAGLLLTQAGGGRNPQTADGQQNDNRQAQSPGPLPEFYCSSL